MCYRNLAAAAVSIAVPETLIRLLPCFIKFGEGALGKENFGLENV